MIANQYFSFIIILQLLILTENIVNSSQALVIFTSDYHHHFYQDYFNIIIFQMIYQFNHFRTRKKKTPSHGSIR